MVSNRMASDGKEVKVTDIPRGLDEKSGIKNSRTVPLMERDISRAGQTIRVKPCWELTYDEDGYCVKCEKV